MTVAAIRSNNRLQTLLDSAAELFSTRGYRETTTRDIAAMSGMLSGSIYYHFPTKDALLVAVYQEGVRRLSERVDRELADIEDPWDRLEAMLAAHIEMIVEPTAYPRVILRILPDSVPAVEKELTALRDDYENQFRQLVDALPLAPHADRGLLRLLIIGAANHTHVWHRPGGATPQQIAKELVRMAHAGAMQQEGE